jgi:CPA2 family monovalent cation:H+ antiporter-2
MHDDFLSRALVFLGATLICVPIAKRLGVGSVLGYLLGGVMIGPFVLGFIGAEGEDIMHVSEFGVVMMLFLVGLELQPSSFWKMRKAILGMGLTQVVFTSLVLFAVLFWGFGFGTTPALVAALAFSMSSTAIALQTLKEKGLSNTPGGRASFAVLLMQDIAVIPILALLPLLAVSGSSATHSSGNGWLSLGLIAAVLLAGKYLINPFLRLIARTRTRELFTASALLIVIGVAWLMQVAGISAALGTFLAGVMLANSEYRHELESDVDPFKGLLLGLFFTAVGSTINFRLMAENPGMVAGLVLAVMTVKIMVMLFIGRSARLRSDQRLLFSIYLCQVGEFAFVLFSAATQGGLLNEYLSGICIAVTTVSMALSPLLIFINERFIDPRFGVKESAPEKEADKVHEKNKVIIAGFGHFGSTVGRFLRANGVDATILDNDSEQVDFLRRIGLRVYYGDATRLDLLKSAGAEEATHLIITLGSEESSHLLVETAKKHFPHLRIFVRSRNRFHTYELMSLGINQSYRESLHTSVYMAADVLKDLGHRHYTAWRKAQDFIRYDEAALNRLSAHWKDKERYVVSARAEIELQEELLREDALFISKLEEDNAWDSEPLRQGAKN